MLKKFLLSWVLLLALSLAAIPTTAQSLIIRPEASIGFMPAANHESAMVQTYGGKLLMGLTDHLRFGLKSDWVKMDFDTHGYHFSREYVSAGIVLEAVVFKYFNLGIGTVANFNLSDNEKFKHNPATLYTHLGFEYAFSNGLMLLAAYQADFIFTEYFGLNNAFKLGVGYRIPLRKSKK